MHLVFGLLRFGAAVLMLPVCVAATKTVYLLARSAHPASPAAPPDAWWFAGGFAFWLLLFFTLPRPVRSYVLAHELTHALWGWLMGARVSGLRVGADRGSVKISRINFLVLLAPYFFPLYTVLVIAAYYALSAIFAVEHYQQWWLAMVGLTWGFHFTFTVTTLLQKQSDVQACGRLFSYAIIYALNVLGIGLWIVAVTPAGLEQMIDLLHSEAAGSYALLLNALHRLRQGLQ